MKAILPRYVLFLFLLAAGFLTVSAGVCYRAAGVLSTNQHRVTDTYEVLGHIEALKGAMWLAERNERNHVITGQEKWLKGYDEASQQILQDIAEVERRTRDSVIQQERMTLLRAIIASRMKSLDDAIVAFREGGIEAARARIVDGSGPKLMERAVGMLDDMEREESRMLAERTAESTRSLRNLLLTFVLVAVMSAGLLGTIFFVVRREVEVRNQAERRIRESEARLLVSIEAAELGIWERNLITGVSTCSERFLRMLRLPENERSPSREQLFQCFHPDDRAAVNDALQEVLRAGKRREDWIETRVVWPDGAIRWVRLQARVIFDSSGPDRRPVRLLGTALDVTDQRRAEANLRDAKERSDAANRAKDQFMAVLSHELRTPLTPVLATVSELEHREDLPADVRDDLITVRRNVEMEARLIDDLLDLTRIARGDIRLHPEVVDVHGVVGAVLEMFRAQAAEKNLRLATDLSAKEHHAWGDPGRLQQILWNLVSNALKFTPADGEIRVRSSNDDAGRLVVEVSDTGIGIEPEVLPRLFNAFEQGERTIARRYGGLGLGLSIAKSIASLHGGDLDVHSEGRGRGTTFRLRLAIIEPPKPAPVLEVKGPAAQRPAATPAANGKLRILLVEDNEDTRRLMGRLLRTFGHHVEAADTVASAVDLAGREDFDLLVSDIGLPDGTGWDLMAKLGDRRPPRAIAISGFGMAEDVRRSKEAGFAEHVTKPVNIVELRTVIDRVAAGAESTPPA